jgi:hypothetical protein
LPIVTLGYQTILSKICNGCHSFCQVLDQHSGQSTGRTGGSQGDGLKIRIGSGCFSPGQEVQTGKALIAFGDSKNSGSQMV